MGGSTKNGWKGEGGETLRYPLWGLPIWDEGERERKEGGKMWRVEVDDEQFDGGVGGSD